MTEHDSWLNLNVEKAIDPELPICDSHHHLRRLEEQRYLAADFLRDASGGHNIKQSVVIQSVVNLQKGPGGGMTPVEETEFVMREISSIKFDIDVAAGFVGFADLTLGNAVAPILESHLAAGKNRFSGIRFIPPRDPGVTETPNTKSVLSEPKFQEGLANLRKHNLTYELMLRPHMFTELAGLAKKFQDTPIIVDHIGWTGDIGKDEKQRKENIECWKRRMSLLVPCNNVYIKLGGLGIGMFGFGWNKRATPPGSTELAEAIVPYYLYCIEQFSVKRCMLESNFPVDKESYSYTNLWNALKRMTKGFSKAELGALFHDTAAQVYRL